MICCNLKILGLWSSGIRFSTMIVPYSTFLLPWAEVGKGLPPVPRPRKCLFEGTKTTTIP